ncbi:MAG: putative porin [Candidatus Omnitrophica bacterium]|nr:putative porin [Candidatus Omnitrophota bacterium]
MGTWRRWLVVGALVAIGLPEVAGASEMDVLLNKLVEKGILTAVEAQEVRHDVAPELAAQDPTQRITLSGDLRLRNEYRDRTDASNANRQRIRFRLGMKAAVTERLEVGARMATGGAPGDLTEGSDPVSTNQTLSDTFAKKSFNLDQAYVKYSPSLPAEALHSTVWGGIFESPFVSTPLVWDPDLTFGGAAVQLAYALGPVEPFLNGGVFPIDADGFGTDNPSLWAVQGGVTVAPELSTGVEMLDGMRLKVALAYYDYRNAVKNALINTQTGNTAAAEDFNELNPYLELASTAFGGTPIALWTDWVHNTAAPAQAGGHQFGVKLGKASVPWDLKEGWELGYFYERLGADAAFDAFVDSDFGGGGTNRQGHVWYLTLAALKNSTVGLKYFNVEEVKGAKGHEDRLQTDWVTKF